MAENDMIITKCVFKAVQKERENQDAKWGKQNHDKYKWLSILMEEVGEASKAVLEGNEPKYEHELIQVAAVAIAAVECIERADNDNASSEYLDYSEVAQFDN